MESGYTGVIMMKSNGKLEASSIRMCMESGYIGVIKTKSNGKRFHYKLSGRRI